MNYKLGTILVNTYSTFNASCTTFPAKIHILFNMAVKFTLTLGLLTFFYSLLVIDCSFLKPNNLPRVGRSNEADGPYVQDASGYVIKTNKNIPRMGRRNYDSGNHYDIPKIYSLPTEAFGQYGDEVPVRYNEEQLNPYSYPLENMK
ncbi:uncharacterized protein LOC131855332 [Achroia grisella]|uniref:uncharacterized protein LOC131855332 n=1 Tax=Achroia grisella TaxID=688607 RepID=UPI0027D1EB83|nr:uncharacterized protein LOC131855332 [Achroia grisella]